MSTLLIAGLVVIGFSVGTLGTLIGAGGGFILMPILMVMYPLKSPQELTAISMAVIFLNALSGSMAYAKKRSIDYRSTVIFSLAAVPGTLLGVYATAFVTRDKYQMLFGVLLIALAAYLLFLRKKPEGRKISIELRFPRRILVDSDGETHLISYNILLGVSISLVVGFVSSILGIGGGIIHVPAMVNLLYFPVHIATATSHSILAVMAGIGTTQHLLTGKLDNSWSLIFCLAPGVVLGAQLGAYLSPRIKGVWILRGLGIALLTVGIRFILA